MALIEWHEDVWQLFNEHVEYAHYEFGKKTSNKWLKEMAAIDARLRQHPESYTPEALLADRALPYRAAHIMKRFKLIHYYDRSADTVYIVDLWDTMQNPKKLQKRISISPID